MPRVAVITGDLINSTKVHDAHGFRERLEVLMELLERKYEAKTPLYRGDGFQAALHANQFNALEAALVIRTGLIAQSPDKSNRWDARVALAFSTKDGDEALSFEDQNSPAFVSSGRVLDGMEKDHFCIYCSNENTQLAVGVATAFVDDIVNQLTPTEAEVLHHFFLDRKSHSDIARQLGKKRPTITLALQRAKYTLLDRFVKDMNKFLGQCDD